MRLRRGRRPFVLAIIVVCAVAALAVAIRIYRTPTPQLLRLADGTEVFYLSNTVIEPAATFPLVREIHIDGEAFVRAASAEQPLVIRSRLMVLTVTGSTGLRVTARSDETGEEADVLYGHVVAQKAYPSQQNDPDTLVDGEEVMVNETIDLQEKETADVPNLRAWSEGLVAAAKKAAAGK